MPHELPHFKKQHWFHRLRVGGSAWWSGYYFANCISPLFIANPAMLGIIAVGIVTAVIVDRLSSYFSGARSASRGIDTASTFHYLTPSIRTVPNSTGTHILGFLLAFVVGGSYMRYLCDKERAMNIVHSGKLSDGSNASVDDIVKAKAILEKPPLFMQAMSVMNTGIAFGWLAHMGTVAAAGVLTAGAAWLVVLGVAALAATVHHFNKKRREDIELASSSIAAGGTTYYIVKSFKATKGALHLNPIFYQPLFMVSLIAFPLLIAAGVAYMGYKRLQHHKANQAKLLKTAIEYQEKSASNGPSPLKITHDRRQRSSESPENRPDATTTAANAKKTA